MKWIISIISSSYHGQPGRLNLETENKCHFALWAVIWFEVPRKWTQLKIKLPNETFLKNINAGRIYWPANHGEIFESIGHMSIFMHRNIAFKWSLYYIFLKFHIKIMKPQPCHKSCMAVNICSINGIFIICFYWIYFKIPFTKDLPFHTRIWFKWWFMKTNIFHLILLNFPCFLSSINILVCMLPLS